MRIFVATVMLAVVAGPASGQSLQERVAAITNRPEYKHGRWGLLVADAKTGAVLLERNPDQMFVPASTTKLYTCSAALAELGADYRFRTRVVSDGMIVDGTLFGDVVLLASGDPTMGGRNLPDGTLAFANGDHTYAEARSTTAAVTPTDPLAGLKDLASQIKAKGVRQIRGDVLIDDRLFEHATSSGSGPDRVTPITINDNVIDFVMTPSPEGVKLEVRPESRLIRVDNRVTVEGRSPQVTVVQEGPWSVSLRGTVPAGSKPVVRIMPISDPQHFARSLLIECLERAGIQLSVSPLGSRQSTLPDSAAVGQMRTLAEHVSAPLHEVTKVTLKVSHNLYASTLPLLIAANHKERTLAAGLVRQGQFFRKLGVDVDGMSFAGGAGGANADSTSPRSTVALLTKLRSRPEYAQFEAGLPILGVDGTLADVVPQSSRARGRVRAKTGTLFWADVLNSRLLLRSKAVAGTMTNAQGRELVFCLFVNDVPLPSGVTPSREGKVLGEICEVIFLHSE